MKVALDAYDRLSADSFLRPSRSPRLTKSQKRRRKKARRIAREIASSGRADKKWWKRYEHYVHSPRWRALKERILCERGAMCERCGANGAVKRLDLHHLSYVRMGHEADEDLKLLCHDCHKLMHPNRVM